MAWEIINWLQDVREHLRVSQRRKALRQPGQGYDYLEDKDSVRGIVSRIHPQRMRLRVTEVVQETPTTKTLCCERVDGPLPPFRAGQYINLFVDVDGILTSRPYSISSAPPAPPPSPPAGGKATASPAAEGKATASPPLGGKDGGRTLDLTVRDKPGGFVAPYLLNEVQVGDELETTGPAGSFYYEPLIDGDDLVFLAGGSGITPFMSILRDVLGRESEVTSPLPSPRHIHLLYGSRVAEDVIFGQELAQLAAAHANFDYTLVISEPPAGYQGLTGLLDARLISERIGQVGGKTFYICGPGVMYDFCLGALVELGVPPFKIRRELYGPPADVTREAGWPEGVSADTIFSVDVVGRKTVRAPAGEPLMNTLERYGVIVPAICRTGACSACRVRLLAGQVFMPAHTGLRESDREHGYIHACVAYPLENLRIQI